MRAAFPGETAEMVKHQDGVAVNEPREAFMARAMEPELGMISPGSLLDDAISIQPEGWSLILVPSSGSCISKETVPTRKNYTETRVGGSRVRRELRSEHLRDLLPNKRAVFSWILLSS